jgi:hypothetical protein
VLHTLKHCANHFGWRLPTDGAALERLADRFSVSPMGTAVTGGGTTGVDTALLQQRIRDAIRSQREAWLWIVAVLAAIACVVSASAAWTATLRHPTVLEKKTNVDVQQKR